MTFSEKSKREVLLKEKGQPCCQIASLSAFIRGAGTISVNCGKIGFEIITENLEAIKYYEDILNSVYGVSPKIEKLYAGKKHKLSLIDDNSTNILIDLGILSHDESGVSINLAIDKYLIENDCCIQAYIKGAFIGGGSVTVPDSLKKNKTNYHLEFVFSKISLTKVFP